MVVVSVCVCMRACGGGVCVFYGGGGGCKRLQFPHTFVHVCGKLVWQPGYKGLTVTSGNLFVWVKAPSCADGVTNGKETDVDCGGSCSPCAAGRTCSVHTDCTSQDCTSGVCSVQFPVRASDCAAAVWVGRVPWWRVGPVTPPCGCVCARVCVCAWQGLALRFASGTDYAETANMLLAPSNYTVCM